MPRSAVRRLADEDAVHRSGRLQARRRIDDVAGGHPLALGRTRVQQHERFAGVDGDAHLQVVLLAHPVADRKGRAHRALGVVLVRDRCAEQRHYGVADELLDGAAHLLELGAQPLPVGREHRADVLGIELLGARREPDQVCEEHGDDFPLLAALLRGGERRPAREAEARDVRIVLPADPAARHGASLGRRYAVTRPTSGISISSAVRPPCWPWKRCSKTPGSSQ